MFPDDRTEAGFGKLCTISGEEEEEEGVLRLLSCQGAGLYLP